MARKKTAAELLEDAKRADQRAKELRAKAAKVTKAEEAKTNAEIIKAVREWHDSLPEEKRSDWNDLPELFRKWANNNRDKYGTN